MYGKVFKNHYNYYHEMKNIPNIILCLYVYTYLYQLLSTNGLLYIYLFLLIYLCIWLRQVLGAAHGIFSLRCGTQNL